MAYSCQKDVLKHRGEVKKALNKIIYRLRMRGNEHDASKLKNPERDIFNEFTPKLKKTTYGSQRYYRFLKRMKKGLKSHYEKNRHHPEHFKSGIRGMNLVDITEMFCDWYAATQKHEDGDIRKSIAINSERFKYGDDLFWIFHNTVKDVFEEGNGQK